MKISGIKAFKDHTLSKYKDKQVEYDFTRLIEPLVTSDVTNIAKSLNIYCDGLENSIKTAKSVDEKLTREIDRDNSGKKINNYYRMRDGIRYTEICNHEDITKITKQTISRLKNKGYVLTAINNYYRNPFKTTGYKGMHTEFISPQGERMEVQIHSKLSFEQKTKGHELYEKLRNPEIALTQDEEQKMTAKLFEIHNKVPDPKGIKDIKPFRLSNDEIYKVMDEKRKEWSIQISENRINNVTKVDYSIIHNNESIIEGKEVYSPNDEVIVNRMISLYSDTKDKRQITGLKEESFKIDKDNNVIELNNIQHNLKQSFDINNELDNVMKDIDTGIEEYESMNNQNNESKSNENMSIQQESEAEIDEKGDDAR